MNLENEKTNQEEKKKTPINKQKKIDYFKICEKKATESEKINRKN